MGRDRVVIPDESRSRALKTPIPDLRKINRNANLFLICRKMEVTSKSSIGIPSNALTEERNMATKKKATKKKTATKKKAAGKKKKK